MSVIDGLKMLLKAMVEPALRRAAEIFISRETELEWYGGQSLHPSKRSERPIEYSFALGRIAAIYPRSVLDVGTGKTAWPHMLSSCGFQVTAIDNRTDYWKNGYWNRHWHVLDDNILNPKLGRTFDLITCISVLEHIADHNIAMKNMMNLLNPGGHLILTGPFDRDRYCPDIYQEPHIKAHYNYPFICQVFSKKEVAGWLADNRARIELAEYYRGFTGNLFREGDRLCPPEQVGIDDGPHFCCLDIVKA